MTFYEHINKVCKDKDTTLTAVLKALNINTGIMGAWKKGSIPNGETLVKISDYLGTTVDFLLRQEDYSAAVTNIYNNFSDDEQEEIAQIIEYYKNIPMQSRQLAISKFKQYLPKQTVKCSTHHASAGTGFSFYDDSDDFEDINIIDTDIANRANFAIRVEGNSMLPVYKDNDIVLIQRTDAINIGQIGIFIADNDRGYIKKLGETELISLNSDYKNIPLTEDIRCIGLVLGTATEI